MAKGIDANDGPPLYPSRHQCLSCNVADATYNIRREKFVTPVTSIFKERTRKNDRLH